MSQPDILIFLSDQHNALYGGFAGAAMPQTPSLDHLAARGTVFSSAYTQCPLCVPSRTAMLTGQEAWRTGAYSNGHAIPETQATFLHSLAVAGYETVLCGRMHFMGLDQRHGFTKRIMGDITSLYWGTNEAFRKEQGPYRGTFGMPGCVRIAGGGDSPVLAYDRAVIKAALDYLRQDHERPQCIVVGTYCPHFPYVAPPKWYQFYRSRVQLPQTLLRGTNYQNPEPIRYKESELDEEQVLSIRAAYYGMISHLDEQIGMVYEEWERYLQRSGREGLFVYLSDHGDTAGEHGIYGKQTFYEGSARIPLIFAGAGVRSAQKVHSPVGIIDLGPTLCQLAGADSPPAQDGVSLAGLLAGRDSPGRYVISEFVEKGKGGQLIPGRMVRAGRHKLISYPGFPDDDLLFDLESDPFELRNILPEKPQVAEELRELMQRNWDVQKIAGEHGNKLANLALLRRWGEIVGPEESERWRVPPEAAKLPQIR